MPSIAHPDDLTAVIGFTLPAERLDHDPEVYLTYDKTRSRPTEFVRVPVRNLRIDMDGEIVPLPSPKEQLDVKGYALAKHACDFLDDIPSEQGTQAYLDQTAAQMKEWLGCTRVIAWNSVVRRNDPAEVCLKEVEQQKEPEKGFIPTTRLQPIASVAHVDQDSVWGKELCRRAVGEGSEGAKAEAKRVMIVNTWRPLQVTNAPLAVCPYTHLGKDDLSRHASQFGIGLDVHHNPKQEWGYIRHQMPDEVILLKCYDSAQGEDGSALYCAHVAVQVDGDAEGIDPALVRPRESIEVRLVAVWE